MDNAEHIAALKITRHWLNNTPKWNFGKFNQDLDQHIYPLLKIRYPLPDEWPLSKKKHIAEYVKERKKDLWRKSLTEIINNNDCDSSECKKALRALASSTDADVEANDIPVEDCLYDQPPPRKRKERDEESPPTREPPPPLGWHRNDTHSPPLYTSSTRSQEDGRNTSGRPPRNISGSNGGKGVKDGTNVRHGGTGVKVEREDVEEEEEEEVEEEEEEEEQGEEAEPGVKGSRPRSASSSLASFSPPLPPGFFQEFDDMLSECEGCCRHANSIGADGEPCLDCCSHPPTEVCSSTPSPPSHPPVPSSSQRKTPNLFTDYRSHHITPSRLASFPPPSNLLRHDTPTPKALVQRCSLAPQLEQLQSQLASNTKRIASHDKILVHHSKQIKENRQDILNHRGVLATMQRVMFLQREVDKTMSELKLQYLGDPDDLAGLSSTSSTNGNESK